MIDFLQPVDWSSLRHAYGPAEDVPRLIRRLRQADWDDAVGELVALLVHNGLYPATSAALPFLAEVALDPEAPGRLGALELLTLCGDLIAETASGRTEFGAQARAELGRSARVLLPLASDPDPEVRIALYECASTWPGSGVEPEARAMLRARFGAEREVRARTALMAPLARFGLLTASDLEDLLVGGPDEVAFAAVLRVAESSRAATVPALEAVLRLSRRASSLDAVRVVNTLLTLAPEAGRRAAEIADAVAGLLARVPADPSLQASSAALLFALQDHRWVEPALVVAGLAEPPLVLDGHAQTSLPAALAGLPASRRPVVWAEDDLVAVARQAVAVRPESAVAWAEVLQLLPPSPAVVDVLLSGVNTGAEPVVTALAQLAAADPRSFTEDARDRIVALPVPEEPAGAWLLTLQALLTGEVSVFPKVWELGGSAFGADELLRIWAEHPSPALTRVCRDQLTGGAATSIPARHRQLVAASSVVESGDARAAWPLVQALVDRAGEPLVQAAALAARIVELEPALAPQWLAQLRDLAEHGRQTWAGDDHGAVAVAVGHLLELGELDPEQAVDRLLAAELDAVAAWQAVPATPVVTRFLGRALALRPDLRARVAAAFRELVSGDARIPTPLGDIATDVRLTALLRPLLT